MQKYLEHIKTEGQISKICKQLFLFFWLPICIDDAIVSLSLSNRNISMNKIIYHINHIYITLLVF